MFLSDGFTVSRRRFIEDGKSLMLLSLDPSSTCTGYATFDGYGRLIESGRLIPKGKCALTRIRSVGADLLALIADVVPSIIVIEISTSKYGRARSKGSNTIVVYGAAWGYCLHVCEASGAGVKTVEANEWTKGRKKAERVLAAKFVFKKYKPEQDPGGDAADAIMLGDWYLREEQMKHGHG